MVDSGLVADGGCGLGAGGDVVDELGQLAVRAAGKRVHRREVRADLAEQLEPVLDGGGHRALVRDDRSSPGLELDLADETTHPPLRALEAESHLVGEPRRLLGRNQDAFPAPRPEAVGGPRILVPRLVVARLVAPQDEAHDVVRAQSVQHPLLIRSDGVVRWRRHPVERTDALGIEEKAGER